MTRERLAELLPRWLALLLRIRRVSPVGRYWPWRSVRVAPIDTGGGFRAAWRMQDPAQDPREPYGGESSSAGSDHGWSNCTAVSAALAIAYQQPRGELAPYGGDMRHRQSDLSGGTDLYDMRTAWSAYGETLNIRSGAGWSALVAAHDEGRAIVVQGTGNVPGAETFDGGHACCIAPETHSGGEWLFGDPLATGWQWVTPSSIRSWAERWQSSIAFATGEKPPPPPEPPEPPEPPKPPPVAAPETIAPEVASWIADAEQRGQAGALDAEVGRWVAYLAAPGPIAGALWDGGRWAGEPLATVAWLLDECDDQLTVWGRGPVPDPVAAARHALETPALWGSAGWRTVLWR